MDSAIAEYHEFKTPAAGVTAANCGLPTAGLDCRQFSRVMFTQSGLTTETTQLQVSHDGGVTWSAGIRCIDSATGALAAASTMGNGSYHFTSLAAQRVRLVKSAASEAISLALGLRS